MPQLNEKTGGHFRQMRTRLRRGMSGKTGKVAGITTIAAPVVGLIVHDLQKPDSVIRKLVSQGLNRFLEYRREKRQVIDATDRVEVIADEKES